MRKLYQDYFHEYMLLFPTLNDYLDLDKYAYLKSKYENNISETHLELQQKLYTKYLTKINKIKNKSHYDLVLKYILESYLEALNYDFHLIPLNHSDNIITYYVEMAEGNSLYKFNNNDDYIKFLEKTKEFLIWIDTSIDNMKLGIKKQIVLPKTITKLLINQLKDVVKSKSYHNPKVPKTLQIDFNREMDLLLLPKIKRMIVFLQNVYLPKCSEFLGLASLPNGKKMYRYLAKNYTTLDSITIKNIFNIGLKECNRVNKEMMIIIKEYGYTDMSKFNKYLLSNKKFKYQNEQQVFSAYRKMQKDINKIMLSQFKDKISHNYLIKPVPKFNQKYAPSAYYMSGDISGKRKGVFYLNMNSKDSLNKMDIESLSLHEGNPGHHYQITYVMDNKDIPLFIKSSSFTGYDEGWGLYTENLGEYKDSLSYYGKLNMEILRSVRLVVDTGIHYYNWSIGKCLSFFQKYTSMSKDSILSEIHRYIACPGQALAYKIGELEILALKKKFKGNIKDFHHKIIKDGPMPLALLKDKFN